MSLAQRIRDVVKIKGPICTADIAQRLGVNSNNVSVAINTMLRRKRIHKAGWNTGGRGYLYVIDNKLASECKPKPSQRPARRRKEKPSATAARKPRGNIWYMRKEKVELLNRLIPRVSDADADLLISILRDYGGGR